MALRLLFPALLLLVTLAGGCARTPVTSTREVKVAVLDGRVAFDVSRRGDLTEEGWWFSARDRFRSPNPGIQLGEALSVSLAKVPGVEVYSRDDLSVYFAQKERLLRRSYPKLDSWGRKQLLLEQDPLDFGRSLNVDYIVRSEVREASTVTNRTFSWWYSTFEANVEVWDVARGRLVFTESWKDADAFDSQLAMAQECARVLRRRMEKIDAFETGAR